MKPIYDYENPGEPLEDNQMMPSEFIEGYLKRFFMIQLEALAFGLHTPEEVRQYLEGVSYFVDCSCGQHAKMATSNIFYKLINLSDENMIKIAKETFKTQLEL